MIAKITENITNRKKSFQVELRDLVGTSTKFARWTPDDRVESASACAFRVCARLSLTGFVTCTELALEQRAQQYLYEEGSSQARRPQI